METNQRLEFVLSTLIRFRKLWILPAIAGVALALIYVLLFRGETWTARQSLIVRDDLLGQSFKLGQFNSLESMKSAQETILEISRKPQVIHSVLSRLGPVSKSWLGGGVKDYPDDATIEDVQGMISFSAPNGAEFGKTEVVILNAQSSSPARARQFISLLLDEMDKSVSSVRGLRLQSIESELILARDGALASLQQSMKKMREMDDLLGVDVGTINGLNSTQPSESSAKTEMSNIRTEKRAVQAQLDSARTAQQMLIEAQSNPERILATASGFLKSEPKLEALSKLLVEAQRAYADNSARYEERHPIIQRSQETINVMRAQIIQELGALNGPLEARIVELTQRIARLDDLVENQRGRLAELGSMRVDHYAVNSEVNKKTEIYNVAESRLSEVQALRGSAGQIELLTRIGEPQIATRPDGLGKKAMVLAGGICGLLFGLGLVMLVAPSPDDLPQSSSKQQSSSASREPSSTADSRSRTSNPTAGNVGVAANSLAELKAATFDKWVNANASNKIRDGLAQAKTAWSNQRKSRPPIEETEPVLIPDVSQTDIPTAKSPSQSQSGKSSNSVQMTPPSEPPIKAPPALASTPPVNSAPPPVAKKTIATPAAPIAAAPKRVIPPPPTASQPTVAKQVVSPPPAVTKPPVAKPQVAPSSTSFEPIVFKNENKPSPAVPKSEAPQAKPNPPAVAESVIVDAKTATEIERYEVCPNLQASDVLAELKAMRALQTAPKIEPKPADANRRPANQRPIDLAKAADNHPSPEGQRGTGAVAHRSNPIASTGKSSAAATARESASTQAMDSFSVTRDTISKAQLATGTDTSDAAAVAKALNDSLQKSSANPFLKHLPGSKPKADRTQESKPETKSQPTLPIPDQIKNLADSIANFGKPTTRDQ